MAEQFLRERSRRGRGRDRVDRVNQVDLTEQFLRERSRRGHGRGRDRVDQPSITSPSPPPAVPQLTAAPWLLVILVVGVVMTDWAAIKDRAIGRFLEPPPLPPIPAAYNYNEVVNETLQQFEKSLAADITDPGRFGLQRPTKQGGQLVDALSNVSHDYRLLWDAFYKTQNQTILRYDDRINAVENYTRINLYDGLADIEAQMLLDMYRASKHVNYTAKALSYIVNKEDDLLVQTRGPQPRHFSPIFAFFRRLFNSPVVDDDDITPNPQVVRDRMMWEIACTCQAYIISTNDHTLQQLFRLREMLNTIKNDFKPAEEFMRKELVMRKNVARVIIEDIHQRYNTSMQEWGASLPNRWYNSSNILTVILGWCLDGQLSPNSFEFRHRTRKMDELERAQARIIFTQAMIQSIEAYLADSRTLISYTATRPADIDANHPCPLQLGNADNSTQPQSPYELLLILEEHVAAFEKQFNSWDEELFHNHVQQAWEKMKGDLYTTTT